MYTDRRCLVGVRPLEEDDGEEGRLKRLLDGLMPWLGNGGAQPLGEALPIRKSHGRESIAT